MDTKTAIAVVIALVVVFGAFALFGGQPMLPTPGAVPSDERLSVTPYINEEYRLAFEYPSTLFMFERPDQTQLALFLVEDTQENRDVLEGRTTDAREGPTGITIDAYQNPDLLSAADWVERDTNWTVATSGATPVTTGRYEGVTFTWSGLYEGRTVVFAQGDKAYVFSVTWLSPQDQIVADFELLLNSLQFLN